MRSMFILDDARPLCDIDKMEIVQNNVTFVVNYLDDGNLDIDTRLPATQLAEYASITIVASHSNNNWPSSSASQTLTIILGCWDVSSLSVSYDHDHAL
jgi:hypothetical protein